MLQKDRSILLLRLIHTAFALYFISCIIYLYYAVFTLQINILLYIAIASLVLEGFLVFILNNGHCPLAPLQRKLKDPVPFFNLFLPEHLAKKAIPFFSVVTYLGILLLVVRMVLN
jgi:hypothetical protein